MPTIQFRTDETIKTQSAEIFQQLGITMSDAINMFLRQSVRQQALPLDFFLGDDGEETLAQSLADMDSGICGMSLDEFDCFMQNIIRKGAICDGRNGISS